jgi:NAD(P)-dependent dehydrogenase (short-subunit alcohol dehydrogenase family)
LGLKHAEAIAEAGGIPVLADIDASRAEAASVALRASVNADAMALQVDITDARQVETVVERIHRRYGRIDILINNAAMTAKGGGSRYEKYFAPFEEYPVELWEEALRINLTGTFLVTQAVGRVMLRRGTGVVVNIASDVGVISPDHRIYEGQRFNTPLAYAVSKAGIISLTRYLATYWAPKIRVNSLSPAGVYDGQDPAFVQRLSRLIPLGRMADRDEYKGAILYLVSDASSFMTGANLIVDGGRTAW